MLFMMLLMLILLLLCIAHTVKTSWKDLGLLFLLVGMGMLVFGSLEYYIGNEEDDTGFTSIPQVQDGDTKRQCHEINFARFYSNTLTTGRIRILPLTEEKV